MLEKLTREQLIQEVKFRDMEIAALKKRIRKEAIMSQLNEAMQEYREYLHKDQVECLNATIVLLNTVPLKECGEEELMRIIDIINSDLREQAAFNEGYNKAIEDHRFSRLFYKRR